MAGDMSDGLCCSECGIFFERSHGYPVLCSDCCKKWSKRELKRAALQRATIPELGSSSSTPERPNGEA